MKRQGFAYFLTGAAVAVAVGAVLALAVVYAIDAGGDAKCITGEWRGESLCPQSRARGRW